MGSVFKNIDTATAVELLTATEPIQITRLTIANVESADTAINVDLFKNSKTKRAVRIIGYGTAISGGALLELDNIYLDTGQFLTLTTDGNCDIDINYKSLT